METLDPNERPRPQAPRHPVPFTIENPTYRPPSPIQQAPNAPLTIAHSPIGSLQTSPSSLGSIPTKKRTPSPLPRLSSFTSSDEEGYEDARGENILTVAQIEPLGSHIELTEALTEPELQWDEFGPGITSDHDSERLIFFALFACYYSLFLFNILALFFLRNTLSEFHSFVVNYYYFLVVTHGSINKRLRPSVNPSICNAFFSRLEML